MNPRLDCGLRIADCGLQTPVGRFRFWLVAGMIVVVALSSSCRKGTTVSEQPSAIAATALNATAEASRQYGTGKGLQSPAVATALDATAVASRQYGTGKGLQSPAVGSTVAALTSAGKQYTIVDPADLAPPKYPTLIEAVKAGDIADVENHILRRENLNAHGDNGFTALHFAAQAGQVAILELLLDYGANLMIFADPGGYSTPLVYAEQAEQWEAAALLRSRGAFCTIFHMALWGDVRGMKEFVDESPDAINTLSMIHESPLHWAARYGKKDMVEFLLDRGADPGMAEIERGSTPFTEAALNNRGEVVKLMVSKGVNIDQRLFYGDSVLHKKAESGDLELADLLLSLGADINAKNAKGWTPLHTAVAAQQKEFAKFLIEKGALIYAADNQGLSPLHFAAQKGLLDMMTFLMDRGASVTRKDRYGRTPLHLAAFEGQQEAVALLIERGAEVDARDKRDQTPLHLAAQGPVVERRPLVEAVYGVDGVDPGAVGALTRDEKRIAVIETLLSGQRGDPAGLAKGAKLEAQNKYGETPLHVAASVGKAYIIELLLDRDAQLEAKENNGRTPLFNAIKNDQRDAVRLLVERGADINVKDMLSRLPLHEAAKASRSDMAELLLTKGTDPNAVDSNGLTPLHSVAQKGCLATGELLIVYGAKVDAPDIIGHTPLYQAAQRGDVRLVKFFLANGANPNVRDRYGRTPLHAAAWEGNWGPVQLLIGEKVDINAQDNNGFTALHVSAEVGLDRMVKLLLERGADPFLLNNDGGSPFHLAETRGRANVVFVLWPIFVAAFKQALEASDFNKVKFLLDDCPDLMKTTINHVTPLHIAAQNGQKDIAELLLARGANVAAQGGMFYKRTPLHDAAANGHLEVVHLLLLMGADPNVTDSRGRTPLDRAQFKQHQEVAELLLSKGGKAGAQAEADGEGEGETEHVATALDTGQPTESHSELKGRLRALIHNELLIAIVMDNRKWVEEIVSKNPLLVNSDFVGFNALYLAVSKGKKDIAELLLDKGANIEAHSDKTEGRTPLHEAVRQGQEDIVKMLLDRGANAFAPDNSGKTPLDIAREENRVEIGKVLQAYMGIQ